MLPKLKHRRSEKDRTLPVRVTDSFLLHYEDIRPTHRMVKSAHRMVYIVGFSLIGSSFVLSAGGVFT